jgi:hypothetical protein
MTERMVGPPTGRPARAQGRSALSQPEGLAQAQHMPTDVLHILVALAALILLAIALGMLSARWFVSATQR